MCIRNGVVLDEDEIANENHDGDYNIEHNVIAENEGRQARNNLVQLYLRNENINEKSIPVSDKTAFVQATGALTFLVFATFAITPPEHWLRGTKGGGWNETAEVVDASLADDGGVMKVSAVTAIAVAPASLLA
ncbi:hypothetical protein NQ315_012940 [Exocentrus adspersus]|uniref:PGG domain-containing protein n=1 Tax=Exocentrus adspersus TaxID=1586481 RepID=A0AAV8VSM6_9CUCU|nr:hypothetical protein NQ315_012940 [Exocentrus adspersus]